MTELIVSVADYDHTMNEVPLFLTTLVPLTPDKAPDPVTGLWACTSPYLGRGYTGPYYIKNILLPTCSTKEERWTVCRRVEVVNPMAFFFDTGKTEPFLVLYNFKPVSGHEGGWGELIQSSGMSSLSGVSWKTK